MKKLTAALLGVSVFMGVNALSFVTDVGNSSVEAALVAQQTASTPAKSKVKSSLINMTGKYDNVRPGRVYGTRISIDEKAIAGVKLGSSFESIIQSLGKPDKIEYLGNRISAVTYGGIYFSIFQGSENMHMITVSNRDAVTVRGVAVGDTLEKVYSLYGQPDEVSKDRDNWFYGQFVPMSDDVAGIRFFHDGNKVTKIVIL